MEENTTETLNETVVTDTELKNWLVNYVGEQHKPENGEVTVGLIVETMAQEFPEFLLAVAEENWIRGYHQALNDVDSGRTMAEEEQKEDVG